MFVWQQKSHNQAINGYSKPESAKLWHLPNKSCCFRLLCASFFKVSSFFFHSRRTRLCNSAVRPGLSKIGGWVRRNHSGSLLKLWEPKRKLLMIKDGAIFFARSVHFRSNWPVTWNPSDPLVDHKTATSSLLWGWSNMIKLKMKKRSSAYLKT